ncbi:hypothetical protein NPIL_123341 [Nephila pilipes]|uniref:Uncharacterized protein n=1 Tax=Nephila pilipes TaxID=299642 RepID=A0A8X6I3F8_NEPPI|nr:hypothetical protein NPIL_123341 [Nephila pilipes]
MGNSNHPITEVNRPSAENPSAKMEERLRNIGSHLQLARLKSGSKSTMQRLLTLEKMDCQYVPHFHDSSIWIDGFRQITCR